tara:strand:+ start:222 stop:428 length:207 start_codon:yes stop_codon:yes gene_type:complete
MLIMDKLTHNILRLSISAALLTIPFSALFIGFEYLGYKRGISNYAEDLSSKYDQLLDTLKDINPELEY